MILAILQARQTSTRLPQKVLLPILGKPMLIRQIERIKNAKNIDQLIVATSTDRSDTQIYNLCKINKIPCFRGNLNDVLDRFYQASKIFKAKHIVRLSGDCPLIDPSVIDNVINLYFSKNYDYVSNTITPTFPDGLDVEIFNKKSLKTSWEKASLPSEREHVTPFIIKNKKLFNIGNFKNKIDLSHLRWTVDEKEDFDFVTKVYDHLYPKNSKFDTQDILHLIKKIPSLRKINDKYNRNEGYKISLNKDFISKLGTK
mgnify:CR=1 FL=1|jgi:spore coat polysaccharide biosynthesis protein SpsF